LFNLGLSEIILIAVIALIFIGPKQLPEIASAIGRALNELKRASEDLTGSITNPRHYTDDRSRRQEQKLTSANQPTTDTTVTTEKKDEGHST
jgi:Tat protein translocase TatB subunit